MKHASAFDGPDGPAIPVDQSLPDTLVGAGAKYG